MKIKSAIKNFTIITIPTIIILLLFFELFFRFIIPAGQRPRYCYDTIYKLNRNVPAEPDGYWTKGKWGQDKTRWHINNFGWNSSIDYKIKKTPGKKRICIIGDSFIEALSVDYNKNIAAKVREYEGKSYEVYSFGFGGAALSQYLQISRYVDKVFNPDILVVLIVHNDFDESLVEYSREPSDMHIRIVNDSCIEELGKIPLITIKRYLLRSAFVRYLEYNLHLRSTLENFLFGNNYFIRDIRNRYNANVCVDSVLKRKPKINIAINYIIKKFKEENLSRQIIFLMDAPRYDIYQNTVSTSNVIWMNKMAKEIIEKNGLAFIDLTTPFAESYKKNHKRLDFGDLDGHWNELGHDIAAKALINYLKSQK